LKAAANAAVLPFLRGLPFITKIFIVSLLIYFRLFVPLL